MFLQHWTVKWRNGDDHKLADFIMDVLGTDISGLPMFLLAKYITHARKDMKAQMCTQTAKCIHTCVHCT